MQDPWRQNTSLLHSKVHWLNGCPADCRIDCVVICPAALTQITLTCDRQITDGQTDDTGSYIAYGYRALVWRRVVKIARASIALGQGQVPQYL